MDKKISELASASSIDAADVSVLVHNNTDYKFTFATLLTFLGSNLSTGAAISFGNTLPQNTAGKNGDVFANTSAGYFAQKISGTWSIVYTLPALDGLTDGTVLYGLGAPLLGTGNNNDTYINTGTGIFYKKASGTWTQVFTMLNGPAGAKGDKGDKGDAGASGKTILKGTANPSNSTDGTNGDFYINTSTYTLFGPKTAGVWGSGISLVGPEGEKGDAGDAGPTGATGATGPAGAVGATGATGAKGDKGDTGDVGPAGATGAVGPGLAAGGTVGQVLAKVDGVDYHTEWVDAGSGGGGAGGLSGQIQFNSSGVFTGNSRLTIDPNTFQFYAKVKNYDGFILDAPLFSTIVLQNNGVTYAAIGSGFTAGDSNSDLAIYTPNTLTLSANTLKFSGAINWGNTQNYGTGSGGTWSYACFGGGSSKCIDFGCSFSGGSFTMGNAGGVLNAYQTFSDWIIGGTGVNIGIAGFSTYSQSDTYAQFMTATKSFILNGGGAFVSDASAIFQVDSTTKGIKPPRMSTTQKNAIPSPSESLLVYDTTLHKLCVFSGSNWETISST